MRCQVVFVWKVHFLLCTSSMLSSQNWKWTSSVCSSLFKFFFQLSLLLLYNDLFLQYVVPSYYFSKLLQPHMISFDTKTMRHISFLYLNWSLPFIVGFVETDEVGSRAGRVTDFSAAGLARLCFPLQSNIDNIILKPKLNSWSSHLHDCCVDLLTAVGLRAACIALYHHLILFQNKTHFLT